MGAKANYYGVFGAVDKEFLGGFGLRNLEGGLFRDRLGVVYMIVGEECLDKIFLCIGRDGG